MPWVVGVVVLATASAHAYLWSGGDRTFVTHPVSVVAMAAAAVAIAVRARHATPPVGRALQALSGSLAVYLVVGAWATAAPSALTAGVWSVAWLFPNVLLSTVGLVAAGLPRLAWALAAVTVPLGVAGALLAEPAVPFEGIATVAPEGWDASGAVDALLVVWNLTLVGAVIVLCVRASRASVVERGHVARAAAVASTAPCLVMTCLSLAILRDPGEVDPTTGSVAYLVAVAGTALLGAWSASATDRWAVRAVAVQWAAGLSVAGGVLLAGSTPVALGAVLVSLMTLAVGAITFEVLRRYERWSSPPAPRQVTNDVPRLSPRENDVLAGVAAGRTNAAIAADLFLSERTVEQHLRSVFDKLDLGDHGETNRRVRAAAVWWQHQPGPTAVEVS